MLGCRCQAPSPPVVWAVAAKAEPRNGISLSQGLWPRDQPGGQPGSGSSCPGVRQAPQQQSLQHTHWGRDSIPAGSPHRPAFQRPGVSTRTLPARPAPTWISLWPELWFPPPTTPGKLTHQTWLLSPLLRSCTGVQYTFSQWNPRQDHFEQWQRLVSIKVNRREDSWWKDQCMGNKLYPGCLIVWNGNDAALEICISEIVQKQTQALKGIEHKTMSF